MLYSCKTQDKKDHKKLRRKLVDRCPKQGDHKQRTMNTERNKVDRKAPITNKHVS